MNRGHAITQGEQSWDDWMRLFANRNEVAEVYADALRYEGLGSEWWRGFNEAIVRRWSLYGLKYIKARAWKIKRT